MIFKNSKVIKKLIYYHNLNFKNNKMNKETLQSKIQAIKIKKKQISKKFRMIFLMNKVNYQIINYKENL